MCAMSAACNLPLAPPQVSPEACGVAQLEGAVGKQRCGHWLQRQAHPHLGHHVSLTAEVQVHLLGWGIRWGEVGSGSGSVKVMVRVTCGMRVAGVSAAGGWQEHKSLSGGRSCVLTVHSACGRPGMTSSAAHLHSARPVHDVPARRRAKGVPHDEVLPLGHHWHLLKVGGGVEAEADEAHAHLTAQGLHLQQQAGSRRQCVMSCVMY